MGGNEASADGVSAILTNDAFEHVRLLSHSQRFRGRPAEENSTIDDDCGTCSALFLNNM